MSETSDNHFVVVSNPSPVARSTWLIKQGPISEDKAEEIVEERNKGSERRWQSFARSEMLFPTLYEDDRGDADGS